MDINMDNDQDYFADGDPEKLLRAEIQNLSRRVEALIELAEKIEESSLFFGHNNNNNNNNNDKKDTSTGSDDSGVIVVEVPLSDFDSAWEKVATAEGGAFKPLDEQINFDKMESKQELDIFGASVSFGHVNEVGLEAPAASSVVVPSPNNLLQWD